MSTRLGSYKNYVAFQDDRFNPIVLAESERTRVVLACFEAGQFIPVHSPPVDVTLYVLEGQGRIQVGEQEREVAPGDVAFAAAGEARGVLAESRLVVLHIVTPPPTASDHAEVVAGLQRGTWKPGSAT